MDNNEVLGSGDWYEVEDLPNFVDQPDFRWHLQAIDHALENLPHMESPYMIVYRGEAVAFVYQGKAFRFMPETGTVAQIEDPKVIRDRELAEWVEDHEPEDADWEAIPAEEHEPDEVSPRKPGTAVIVIDQPGREIQASKTEVEETSFDWD